MLDSKNAILFPIDHLVSFRTTITANVPNQKSMDGDGKRPAAGGHPPMKQAEMSHSPIDLRGPECEFLRECWQQQ